MAEIKTSRLNNKEETEYARRMKLKPTKKPVINIVIGIREDTTTIELK